MTGKVVWYSHLFNNFPQFVVIDTVKGFGIVIKSEVDVSLELSCFFDDKLDCCCFQNSNLTNLYVYINLQVKSGVVRKT